MSKKLAILASLCCDITVLANEEFTMHEKNPNNRFVLSPGGVGLNMAADLKGAGYEASLFSIIGNDVFGDIFIAECAKIGVDTSFVERNEDCSTGTFIAVTDKDGGTFLGLGNLSTRAENIPYEYHKRILPILEEYDIIFIGTTLGEKVLELLKPIMERKMVIADTEAACFADRFLPVLPYIDRLKVNEVELIALAGALGCSDGDTEQMARVILENKVSEIFVTLGERGLYYSNGEKSFFRDTIKIDKIASTNGSGDAFSAGLCYAAANDCDLDDTILISQLFSKEVLQKESGFFNEVLEPELLEILDK